MKLLFPTVIHEIPVKNFKSIKKELVDFVYDQQQRDSSGVVFSNSGGWQSQSVYHTYDNILLRTIKESVITYFKKNILLSKEIKYEGLWMNINKKGNFNLPHDHPGCNMAAVFWIKSSPRSGNIEFQSPHNFTGAAEIESYTNDFGMKTNAYSTFWINPTEGSIVMFPASLVHRVCPNENDEDRISASFNISLL